MNVNKTTAAYYFHRLRLLIYQNSPHLEMFDGEIEADESYFGGTHFAEKQNHINGIENFWNQAKRHLRNFNGIPKAHFELYLKECEWRFNHSNLKSQISILKQLVKGNLV